ncbi:MAG TPA: acyl-CoA dehydrogenase family protein [Longimicrobium sp.]
MIIPTCPARSAAATFVRDHVALRVEAWERERAAPFAEVRALGRAGLLPAAEDAAGRLELADALGRAGSLGTAATLLHAVGAPLLLLDRHAGPAVQARVLTPMLAGEAVGCVAWAREGDGVRAQRLGESGGLRLDGVLGAVLNAPGADWVIVPLELVPGAGTGALAVVSLADPGVSIVPRGAVGLHAAALGEVRLDGCLVDPAQRVFAAGAPGIAGALAEERLLLATAVVAAAEEVLRRTLAFAGTRAFGPGRVLGDQQAVRHRLADLMADLEIAAAFAGEAADACLRDALAPPRAAALMLVTVDAALRVAEGCMQLMGARGFMADHPASHLYRDLLSVGLLAAGDPGALERAAAEDLRAVSAPPAHHFESAFGVPA